MTPRTVASMLLVLLAAACGSPSPDRPTSATSSNDREVRLLAIGDSVLEWNGDQATPDVAARVLGERGVVATVENRAVGGSCLGVCGDPGTPIPETYVDGDWTHVLVSGGGNDPAGCEAPDTIMGPDLSSGIMVELVDRVPDTATVLLYRYSSSVSADDPGICPGIRTLMERYAAFAANRDEVVLVDAGSVANDRTPSLWDDDVHPSVAGSEAIGTLVADLIASPG